MRRANEFQRTDLDLILFIRFSLDVYIIAVAVRSLFCNYYFIFSLTCKVNLGNCSCNMGSTNQARRGTLGFAVLRY